jgi:hypothetical protein
VCARARARPKAGLDEVERESLLSLSGIEIQILGCQARRQVTVSTELMETDFGWLSMSTECAVIKGKPFKPLQTSLFALTEIKFKVIHLHGSSLTHQPQQSG